MKRAGVTWSHPYPRSPFGERFTPYSILDTPYSLPYSYPMASAPLKPVIKGMAVMLMLAGAVLFGQWCGTELKEMEAKGDRIREEHIRRQAEQQERFKTEDAARKKRAEDAERRERLRQEAAELRAQEETKKPPLDVGAAFGGLLRKAEAGDAYAQFVIGEIHYYGITRILSQEMDEYAGILLGADYVNRRQEFRLINLPRLPAADMKSAFPWLLRSAQQGNAYGMSGVRNAYMYGRGTELDRVEAFKWAQLLVSYAEATEAGRKPAYAGLNRVFRAAPSGLYDSLTPEQKATVQQRVAEFRPKKEKP